MRLREVFDDKFHDYKPNDIFIVSIGREDGKMRPIAEKFPNEYKEIKPLSDLDDSSVEGLFTVEIVAIIVSSTVMFLTILYALCNSGKIRSGRTKWDSNDRVMDYLDEFNDDDVELHVRHSATGGIHGIYDFKKAPMEAVIEEEPTQSNTTTLQSALSIVDSNKAKLSYEQKT